MTSDKKLRILQVTPEFPPYFLGGGGLVVMNLSQELTNQGHSVTVLSGYYPTTRLLQKPFETRQGNLKVQWLPLIPALNAGFQLNTIMPPNPKSAFKMIKFLRSNMFDAIQIHGFGHLICDFASIACRILGYQYIVTIHGFPKEPVRRGGLLKISYEAYRMIIGSHLMKNAKVIVAVSRSVAHECLTFASKRRIKVLTNAVELQSYLDCPSERISQVEAKYNLNGKKVLLCIGRLSEAKGFQFVIRSLKHIIKAIPEVHLVIVGKDDGYGYLKELKKIVNQEGVESAVTFVGGVNEEVKTAFLWLASVVIIPSTEEAFGIVALEALASGAPIIGSQLGGLKDILSTDKYSLLVGSTDIKAIANATIKILKNKEIGLNARANRLFRIKPYRLQKMTANYTDLYLSLNKSDKLTHRRKQAIYQQEVNQTEKRC